MEMWCPDDIGRDSWDWVGPPAWERACFNSPEWGGCSSLVKTEPLQILLLLLLFWTRALRWDVYGHKSSRLFGTDPVPSHLGVKLPATQALVDPLTTKKSSSSRARKTGAQLRDNPEERENGAKCAEKKPQPCSKLSLKSVDD